MRTFWLTYNQVKLASDLPAGFTYSVFRRGILPDWEDVGNREGGRWMARFSKKERKEMLENRWLEVLYMLLGEEVEEGGGKVVVGAEACVRKKSDRLEVWVGDAGSMEGVVKTGKMLKNKLRVEDKIGFSPQGGEGGSRWGEVHVVRSLPHFGRHLRYC